MKVQNLKNITSKKSGFTLVEVLVVIGILAILLAVTLVAINPGQHFKDSRNSQRQANVTAILDAVYAYESQHSGSVPPSLASVASTPSPLSKHTTPVVGEVDVCADLVPAAIADLPFDPSATLGSSCSDTEYDTGYEIAKSASNRFTVSAPDAEGTTISVTR